MVAGRWVSAFGFERLPVLLMILVVLWCAVAWLVAGRLDALDAVGKGREGAGR